MDKEGSSGPSGSDPLSENKEVNSSTKGSSGASGSKRFSSSASDSTESSSGASGSKWSSSNIFGSVPLSEKEEDNSFVDKEGSSPIGSTARSKEVKSLIEGFSSPSSSAPLSEEEEVYSRSIYITNVDSDCSVKEVEEHFVECGPIKMVAVTIAKDNHGNPIGFACVEFSNVETAQSALSRNNTVLHGRQIKVTPWLPKDDQ